MDEGSPHIVAKRSTCLNNQSTGYEEKTFVGKDVYLLMFSSRDQKQTCVIHIIQSQEKKKDDEVEHISRIQENTFRGIALFSPVVQST